MARISRAVIPGLPHHVTQRGNRRQLTFFGPDDYDLYLRLMAEACGWHRVDIWAYCLMPNHAHLITVPETEAGLRLAMSECHRRFTTEINQREGWQGHLWQGRFFSHVMDERYTLAAARYIELNPVRAGLVTFAEQYQWSSARAHLSGRDDRLVRVEPLLTRVPDWRRFLGEAAATEAAVEIRKHAATGRPLGSEEFIQRIEAQTGRRFALLKGGRPPTKI